MMSKFSEQVALLGIGTVVSVVVTLATFLVSIYFGSFVTKAEYNNDKITVELIKNDLKHLKEGQNEIKSMLKSIK